MHLTREREVSAVPSVARWALWLAWQAVRLPVLAFLVILEPVVRVVLSSAALLGVLTAFLFEFSGARRRTFRSGHSRDLGWLHARADGVLRAAKLVFAVLIPGS